MLAILGALVVAVAALLIVPQVAGFGDTLRRVRTGNKAWLLLAVTLEAVSLASYVALFRTVFSCAPRIGWRTSYQITLAGTVATKMLATAGAGGVALTAWALRAAGVDGPAVARRMAAFQVILYAIYMAALALGGVGLATGVLPGDGPLSVTVVPAAFGACAIVVVAAIAVRHRSRTVPGGQTSPTAHVGRLRRTLNAVSYSLSDGIHTGIELLRRPHLGHLGAVGYWAFDIATLWAAFHAFGSAPPVAIVVMAYFVGLLANVIPLPGGVGGVEGGMVGCLLAFGVDSGVAVLAVLTYRGISFWLPTLPGLAAYLQLRRTVARWRRGGEEGRSRAPEALPAPMSPAG